MMMSTMTNTAAEDRLERAVGEIYAALYQMHEARMYQEEYDSICTIINILTEDRLHFLRMHGDKINA